jgi:hypothetical protein
MLSESYFQNGVKLENGRIPYVEQFRSNQIFLFVKMI